MVVDALATCVNRASAPWYWACKISKFLSNTMKDFIYLRVVSVED